MSNSRIVDYNDMNDNFDNICDVADLRKTDDVLQVRMNLQNIDKFVKSVESTDELPMTAGKRVYSKIFVDSSLFEDVYMQIYNIELLTTMNTGLIIIVGNDEDLLMKLSEYLETYWYPASSWICKSSEGTCLITDASGMNLVASMWDDDAQNYEDEYV